MLRKKNKARGLLLPGFKKCYKAMQSKQYRPMEQNREHRNKCSHTFSNNHLQRCQGCILCKKWCCFPLLGIYPKEMKTGF